MHQFAEYNPVHKVVLFGGGNGSNAMYRVDGTGKIDTLKNAPLGVGIMKSIITVDPVSGMYLVFGSDTSFWEYDVTADSWKELGGTIPFHTPTRASPIWCTVAAPISNYGVIMFVKYHYDSGSWVYLYKHSDPSSAQMISNHNHIFNLVIRPNPFNNAAEIRLDNLKDPVNLYIYTLSGRLVKTILSCKSNVLIWHALNLSNGLYIVKANSGKTQLVKRLLLQK